MTRDTFSKVGHRAVNSYEGAEGGSGGRLVRVKEEPEEARERVEEGVRSVITRHVRVGDVANGGPIVNASAFTLNRHGRTDSVDLLIR